MFWGIWCYHIDHALLETFSWYSSTKFLNWFLKQPTCPRNICTEHWRKLPNVTTFLDIYLYLKSKNNDDSVKHVWKVLLNLLFIYFSLCIFFKFLMSFLKAQVTFALKFASSFSPIRHNSSVPFYSSNIIYFRQRNQLKSKSFRFSSARVKIC